MSRNKAFPVLSRLIVSAVLCVTAIATVEAAPMKVEAIISPKAESKLEFADGSNRYLIATQRQGQVAGNGPLSGTTMLEWGMHDVTPGTGANGNGYLIFTAAEGDIAYLKYQFRALQIPVAAGKRRVLINGNWEVVGGTGKFQGLRGGGTIHVKPISPKERHWILEGDLL